MIETLLLLAFAIWLFNGPTPIDNLVEEGPDPYEEIGGEA
jgi:hypothetical protein